MMQPVLPLLGARVRGRRHRQVGMALNDRQLVEHAALDLRWFVAGSRATDSHPGIGADQSQWS